MANLNQMKLGKLPVKYDARTLKLSKYLLEPPPPPPQFSCQSKVADWGMMLNDELGDCTCAAAGHMVQQWTTYASTEKIIPDNQILKAYMQVSGYVPGEPNTDNGAVVLDVLKLWRKKGIGGHKILAYAALKPGNLLELKQAISIFGNVYLGIELPVSAQDQNECWAVPSKGPIQDGLPGSWGGHAIPAVMYDDVAIGIITWGQLMYLTPQFYRTYVTEAYAVLSNDWLQKNGLSPTHFDLATLKSDLSIVTQ